MPALRLLPLPLLLAACHLPSAVTVNASTYVCPDGRLVQAGLTEDGHTLRLVTDGHSHTLTRQGEGDSYSNGYYTARRDDLFLHLSIAGTLLPQHCRLQTGTAAPP